MNAVLWDGNKQLHGSLEFEEKGMIFKMKDFSRTHLNLQIAYGDIAKVSHYKIYQLVYQAIEITSMDGRRNVFVVDEPMVLKRLIEGRVEEIS